MAAAQTVKQQPYQQQQQQQQQQYQQQQLPPPHPRVLYRRPTSVGIPKAPDDWIADEGPAAAPLVPTPSARVASAPSPTTRQQQQQQQQQQQRAASQHVVWAKDAHSPVARAVHRPASAGSPAAVAAAATAAVAAAAGGDGSNSGGGGSAAAAAASGGGARVFGGSPSLNAAAAALAERQAVVEALASLKPHCRCCRDGPNPPSSIGGSRKDVEGLAEELRRLRGELAACQEQNRLVRTERQRMEEELNRCRTSLIKTEEMLGARERSLSPNTLFRSPATSTTSLVSKLREQLAATQSQSESLRKQLDEIMRGTRATRMSELHAEVKAQERELHRQGEMVAVMRRRMEEAEARAAEAIDRCNTSERLARMQAPLAALQQAITVTEAKFNDGPAPAAAGAAAGSPAVAAVATVKAQAAALSGAAVASDMVGQASPRGGANRGPAERGSAGGAGGLEGGTPSSPSSSLTRQSAAAPPPQSSSSTSSPLSGGHTLTSGRVKKTMAALGDAHRALLSQATLLTELFPPGLTTEQLCIRAALRPATSGAPEVLRYLRHHVHKMVDVLSVLPGNRLEMIQEEEPGGNGNNRNGNNRNNRQRGTPRTSMTGQGLRASGGGGKARSGGGGGGTASAGGSGGGGAPEEFDPWSLLSELLDFVRWLRGLDRRSLDTRPDLEGGLEQLSSVVGICDQETRRLLGRLEGAVAGNGA